MIGALSLALWIAIATLAGIIGSRALLHAGPTLEAVTLPYEHVMLDPLSVPIIRDGKVTGYVIARLAFTASSEKIKKAAVPLELYVVEAAFGTIYGKEEFTFDDLRPVDTAELRRDIETAANSRLKDDPIKSVILREIAYLSINAFEDQRRR